MPDGFIEQMERIADHLGDGWVAETLAVTSDGVGATARYTWAEERHVTIEWTVGANGHCVTLHTVHDGPQTWLRLEDVDGNGDGDAALAADAIQDCAWFVEQELTAPTQVSRYGGGKSGSDIGPFERRSPPRSSRFSRV